jgi:hypothetical protein
LVKAEFHHWSHKTEGLSAAASAVISLAVSIATGGAGSGLAMGLATGVGFTGMAASMVAAGLSTLASQATIALINNKGHLGKTLKEMGSSANMKSLAASVVSAGFLERLPVADCLKDTGAFGKHLQKNVFRLGVNSALDGKIDAKKTLLSLATQTAADALGERLASAVKSARDLKEINSVGHKLAHGAVGALTGAISNPDDPLMGAASGAFGGFMAETVAEAMSEQASHLGLDDYVEHCLDTGPHPTQDGYFDFMVDIIATHHNSDQMIRAGNVAKLVTATGALLARLDPSIASYTAANAIENNFLSDLLAAEEPEEEDETPLSPRSRRIKDTMEDIESRHEAAARDVADKNLPWWQRVLQRMNRGHWETQYAEAAQVFENIQCLKAADRIQAALAAGTPVSDRDQYYAKMGAINLVGMTASVAANAVAGSRGGGAPRSTDLGKHGLRGKSLTPKVLARESSSSSSSSSVPTLKIKRDKDGRATGLPYTQSHHIISDKHKLTQNHDLWKLAGMSPDDKFNKMLLPTQKGVELGIKVRSIHQGRHLNIVNERLAEEMDRILKQGTKEHWSQLQYKTALKGLIREEHQLLKEGKRKLNKHHRPGAINE